MQLSSSSLSSSSALGDSQPAKSSKSRCFLLLPCAGVGARAGAQDAAGQALPKQYQVLAGKAVVQHTLDALAPLSHSADLGTAVQMLLVLAPDDVLFAQHCQLPVGAQLAYCGGATRAATVANGLDFLQTQMGAKAGDWVLVHDAARCLIEAALVQKLITACQAADTGGLLALPVADTIKQSNSDGSAGQRVARTVDRADKWLAQTPQMFRLGQLQAALQSAGADAGISDEASAMELAGHQPLLVPGATHNFKVTYPEDFALAEALLHLRQSAPKKTPAF